MMYYRGWNALTQYVHLLHSDVKQYDNLVKTVYFLLKEYKKSSEKAGCSTITDKSGSYSKFHLF
jgi:hypothetical protein